MQLTAPATGSGRHPAIAISVIAAALGYFVDLYDIVIFGVVRVASLNELGITGADNTLWGVRLLNLQMAGMLIGGFMWGMAGDRLGRRFALLATIATYSLANIASGLVTNVEQYAVLRFIAGVGLAGELGAGVTLVSELLPERRRGYGTTLIAVMGLLGALTASYLGSTLHWRMAYFVGGGMGLAVLALRAWGLRESGMFVQAGESSRRGDLRLLLWPLPRLGRFFAVIALGVPVWYGSALFVNLAPEYGRALGLSAPLTVADALGWQAIGAAIGAGLTGLASEWLRSRRRVVLFCFVVLMALTLGLLGSGGATPRQYCLLTFGMGLAQGYWTTYLTLAAEQFGTNLRATVTTAVPNVVRATTVPITLSVLALTPMLGLIPGTLLVGVVIYLLAFGSLWHLRETYGSNLDYQER